MALAHALALSIVSASAFSFVSLAFLLLYDFTFISSSTLALTSASTLYILALSASALALISATASSATLLSELDFFPALDLSLRLLRSLVSKPGYICLLLLPGLRPCPCPLFSISLSLRPCLPCLPHLLRFFLYLSLRLSPCLSLRPLSLSTPGLRLGFDPGSSLHRCHLNRISFLPHSCFGLSPRPLHSLIIDSGYLCLLLCFFLVPHPCPFHILSLSLHLCLSCLSRILRLFPDLSINLGPCLSLRPISLCSLDIGIIPDLG